MTEKPLYTIQNHGKNFYLTVNNGSEEATIELTADEAFEMSSALHDFVFDLHIRELEDASL
jgi:hypothetical protein